MKTNTKKTALSALLASLSFVLMYLGTITGVFDLCAVFLGALGCVFAVIELGKKWACMVAAVTSVLCLLLLPDKFAAMEYIIMGGIYPIVKSAFEKLPKIPSWIVKLLFFNALFTVAMVLAKFVLNMNEDWLVFGYVSYGFANVFFVVFDIGLTTMLSAYINRLRQRFHIKF